MKMVSDQDKNDHLEVSVTIQGGQKTVPLCYIVYNFGNTAQSYTIFLQKSKLLYS